MIGFALLLFPFVLLGFVMLMGRVEEPLTQIAEERDIEHFLDDATADELEFIHRNKTAAMIEAALVMGARIARPPEPTLATLRRAGQDLGLAFQIIDDILDVTADSTTLGKTAGKDLQADKATYVKLHGLPASRRMADHLSDSARTALQSFGSGAAFLVALVDSMAHRSN